MRIISSFVLNTAVVLAMVSPLAGSFTDTFDGPELDSRWTNDNSPSNPVGSDIAIVAGQAVGSGCKENLYNHLETAIDAGGVAKQGYTMVIWKTPNRR